MARQCGAYTITGTTDHLCFYKMDGNFYVRRKSSLTAKRVKTDAAFARTMQYAHLLGKGSKIASTFYKTIPEEQKEKGLYKKLTGIVMRLLKEGKDEDSIFMHLQQLLLLPTTENTVAIVQQADRFDFADALLQAVFAEPINFESFALKDYGFV